MHSPLDSSTHILGICMHPYSGARVSSLYASTHVPMPRRLLSKSSAAFLCLSLPVFGSLSVYQLKKKDLNVKKKAYLFFCPRKIRKPVPILLQFQVNRHTHFCQIQSSNPFPSHRQRHFHPARTCWESQSSF